jgi:argininosuccinate synthase
MKKEPLVLAYSGGLDTSYSLKKLSQDGYEIHAVSVNTGGFSSQEIETIESKAYQMGAFTYQNMPSESFKPLKLSVMQKKWGQNTLHMEVQAREMIKCVLI